MSQFLPKIALILNPLILAIVLAYTYTWTRHYVTSALFRNAIMGGIMALAAMFAMLGPLELADGVIIDLRNLIVGLAGAFFGVVGLAITMVCAVWMRVHIGGAGTMLGIYAIMTAGIMGLVWARFVQHRFANNLIGLAVLSGMISTHLLIAFGLPQPIQSHFFIAFAPWILGLNFVGVVLIGALIQSEEKSLRKQDMILAAANTDPLTQLLNRRSLTAQYDKLSSSHSSGRGMAMLCFDIDHFKGINDRNGHLFGDGVLLEITRRVSGCLRPTDLFSRIGGDEFVIILPSVNEAEAALVADRCRAAVADQAISYDGDTWNVTISIGANWTREWIAFNTLLSSTDEALYNAKALGRDCVAFDVRRVNLPTDITPSTTAISA